MKTQVQDPSSYESVSTTPFDSFSEQGSKYLVVSHEFRTKNTEGALVTEKKILKVALNTLAVMQAADNGSAYPINLLGKPPLENPDLIPFLAEK